MALDRTFLSRRTARALMAVLIAIGCLASSAPSGAAVKKKKAPKITYRTVNEDYVGSTDPLTAGRCKSMRIPQNVGKTCFPLKSGDYRLDITLVDEVDPAGAFFWIFYDANSNCPGDSDDPLGDGCPNTGFACERRRSVVVPKSAVLLEVHPLSGLGVLECVDSDGAGATTTGTVTVKITNKK